MRGAGCTINDMWDRDYDKKVVSSWKGIGSPLSILYSDMVASLLQSTEGKGSLADSLKSSMRSAGFQLSGWHCTVRRIPFLHTRAARQAGRVLHFYKMN